MSTGSSDQQVPSRFVEAFSVFSVVVSGVVAARTAGQLVGHALTLVAISGCSYLAWRRPGWRRWAWLLAAGVIVALIYTAKALSQEPQPTAVAPGASPQAPDATAPAGVPEAQDPGGDAVPVLLQVDGYALKSSSSFIDNDQDKVDLDTGEPGYGALGSVFNIGPGREGGLAELILEDAEIHAGADQPLLVEADAGRQPGHERCRELLEDRDRLTPSIANDQLHQGDWLCVRTDLGRVAAVRIDEAPAGLPATARISFTVWE